MSENDAVKNVMELGRAALDVAEERDRLRAALEIADAAMKQSVRIGCTDHLDASDDHGAFWYEALDAIDTALASDKGGAHE